MLTSASKEATGQNEAKKNKMQKEYFKRQLNVLSCTSIALYKDLNLWKSTRKDGPFHTNGNRNIGHFSHNREKMKEESKAL